MLDFYGVNGTNVTTQVDPQIGYGLGVLARKAYTRLWTSGFAPPLLGSALDTHSHSKRGNVSELELQDPYWQKPEHRAQFQALNDSLSLPSISVRSSSQLQEFIGKLVAFKLELSNTKVLFGKVIKVPLAIHSPVNVDGGVGMQTYFAVLTEEVVKSILGYPDNMSMANMTVRLPSKAELEYIIDLANTGAPAKQTSSVSKSNWSNEFQLILTIAERQYAQYQTHHSDSPQSSNHDLLYGIIGTGGAALSLLTAYGALRCYRSLDRNEKK